MRTFFEITMIVQVRPSIRHSAQQLPGGTSGSLLVRCLCIIIELYAFSFVGGPLFTFYFHVILTAMYVMYEQDVM